MRNLLVVLLLSTIAFAGCLGDGSETDGDSLSTGSDSDSQNVAGSPEKPQPRFEPRLILATPNDETEFEKGANVDLIFDITDRDDYQYPATFIDWALFYEREPTPVLEGDGNGLPGTFNRSLFGNAFHLFGLRADDGQGLKDFTILVVQTGEPSEPYPDAARLLEFKNTTLKYYNEWEPPVAADGTVVEVSAPAGAVYETTILDETLSVTGSCWATCRFATGTLFGHAQTTLGCAGLHANSKGDGCSWLELPPGIEGTVLHITGSGKVQGAGYDSPQGVFLDACEPYARQIELVTGFVNSDVTYDVPVPPGANCLMVYPSTTASGSIHVLSDEFEMATSGNIPYTTEPLLEIVDGPMVPCTGDGIQIVYDIGYSEIGYNYRSSTGCPGFLAGPYSGIQEGFWIPVDSRHEGAAVAAVSISTGFGDVNDAAAEHLSGTDSDCVFLDHMLNEIGNGNNGGGPCLGILPEGTHWIYVYQWDVPAYAMTFELALDPAKSAANGELGRPIGDTLMADYVDEGAWWRHSETNVCYMKDSGYIILTPGVEYADPFWFWHEANGIPGLQVDANTPYPDPVGPTVGVIYTDAAACVDGDATLL